MIKSLFRLILDKDQYEFPAKLVIHRNPSLGCDFRTRWQMINNVHLVASIVGACEVLILPDLFLFRAFLLPKGFT
jgi:hypothetical protein